MQSTPEIVIVVILHTIISEILSFARHKTINGLVNQWMLMEIQVITYSYLDKAIEHF